MLFNRLRQRDHGCCQHGPHADVVEQHFANQVEEDDLNRIDDAYKLGAT